MLSVHFHSYVNEHHHCGECREEEFGPVCCDTWNTTLTCPYPCGVRLAISIEPYNSSIRDIYLKPHKPDFSSDNISIFRESPNLFNYSRISNPYDTEFEVWTVSIMVN